MRHEHIGTAVNPVLRGFAPDPSMIRVGDWYYLATSTFEWFPTIPVHRSRDLRHWQYAGSVDTAAPAGHLRGVPDSAGIWAPALSHDGNRFWVVYAVVRSVGRRYFDLDVWASTADAVGGPWSAPVRLPSTGFDPSLHHEDGRLWLLNIQNDHRPGGNRFDGVVLTELDPATLRPVAAPRLLLQHGRLVEGPKVVRHEDWYHLLLAEGGTGFEHGVLVARSRRLDGPYELDSRPLLTSRDDPGLALQKAGHGELVQAPDGRWFLGHLAARPEQGPDGPRSLLGRETAVQEIVWRDGWPRLAGGGWHPAVTVRVPEAAPDLTSSGGPDAPSDEGRHASDDRLTWPWSTLREPASADWVDSTARPGWIRLRGRDGLESLWAQSLLAQRLTEHRGRAGVVVDADPRTFTQSAGLALRYSTSAYVALHLTWAEPEGEPQRGQQWGGVGAGRRVLDLVSRDGERVELVARVPAPVGAITLEVEWSDLGARFSAGPAGGVLEPVGPVVDVSALSDEAGGLRFTGTLVAISAHDLVDAAWCADFTGFRLEQDPLPAWT